MKEKPKIVAIIQARMGSKRLPKKTLMPLAGKPLIDHVLERVLKSSQISQVVVAIPHTPENEAIAARAGEYGVDVFRGREDDLVDRYYQAAKHFKADVIVRVCADNPLIHPEEIDRIVHFFLHNDFDFVSNVGPVMGNNYPDGLGAEVFHFEALEWIHENIADPYCREHVHENFYRNRDRFKLGTVQCPPDFSCPDIVLDINTPEEFAFINKLFNEIQKPNSLIHIKQIIPWYRKNKELIPHERR